MLKRLLILCFVLFFVLPSKAQIHGNEWINFSQQYYRFPIAKTGLYRLDSTTLANSGIPINTINPKNIQLLCKGQYVPLYINGENDNVLNTSDYIEFYAEKNDGKFDSLAYNSTKSVPNPYVALFNDTNYVYFTWTNTPIGNRYNIETDLNFLGYTAVPYFYNEKLYIGTTTYSSGKKLTSEYLADPRYIEGEGYGIHLAKGNNIQPSFGNLNVYQSSLPVFIKAQYSGNSEYIFNNSDDHQLKLEFSDNTSTWQTIHDTIFRGYQQIQIQKQITANQLQNASALKLTSISNVAFSAFDNATNLHYISLKYPQIPNLANQLEQLFYVDENSSLTKTFLDIQNVNTSLGTVILYDLTTNKKINVSVTGNNVKALIPNSSSQKKCLLTNSSKIINVTWLTPVNQTGFFTDFSTNISDSTFVIVANKKLESSASLYKQYRQTLAGGNNQVILAYVEELYDQFAYGNQKNPLAIKNFCKYLSDDLPKPPKYLLLLGKSIKNDVAKVNATYWNANDLPTMGIPASDNLFTAGIHGANSSTPFIPVGRISALNNQQVFWYLDKVKLHEDSLNSINEKGDWHKRVLHFSGGDVLAQQQQFQGYLDSYANTIKDTLFGGRVFEFKKTSTAPIQITVSDSVKQLINYGTKIITFFGHGSAVGFDQAIDDPNDYNNFGKYPLFLANSCYSGDIHELGTYSTSEKFTLIDKKGCIAFIASSSLGLVHTLHNFSGELYRSLGYEKYMGGIGDAIKNASVKTTVNNLSVLQEINNLEMTLEGDPSMKLNAFAKPDYQIKNTSVFFNTTSYVDSIGINISVKNIGRAINDTFIVRTVRYFPNNDSLLVLKKMKAPHNNDTLSFFINKDFANGIGLNKFKIHVDAFNEISELVETNNTTIGTVDLFITGGDVVPVYPYKYAIIPITPTITLKASTADPLYQTVNYRLQIDTSDVFSNPISTAVIASSGGVVEWNVNLPYPDSTVYFWRITKDSILITDHLNWRESSFQTIGNKTGWSQAHFHQFKNDSYQFAKYKKVQRKFVFENDIKSLVCNNGFLGYLTFDQINYEVNNVLQDYWTSPHTGGWSFAVFDSITAEPYVSSSPSPSIAGQFNNCLIYSYPHKSISYGANNSCGFSNYDWKLEMENFLNSIPPNNKILAWSIFNYNNQTYSNALYQQFESFGASQIRTIKDSVPYIIFGTKGSVIGSAKEAIGVGKSSVIKLEDTLKTRWNSGYIASEIIGPSIKWRSLHWKQMPVELPNKDSIVIKVIGIKNNGLRDTLTTFNSLTTDVLNLDTYIDASVYPTMQLVARMKDAINLTPPQLKKWQVIYDEVPECAINPKKGYSVTSNDTLQEGNDLVLRLPIENIGTLPFNDSLVITYWLEDKDRVNHPLPQKLKAPIFASSQTIIDTIKVKTANYSGLNYLWVDVNNPTHNKYQLEQYHFNNVIRIPFLVEADKINPLLDVTFDGTHILNGDVVSAKPFVLITLKDENKFLALNDTADFLVYIKEPNQNTEKRLYFNNGLQFTPAQLPNNSCKIEWRPVFATDGKYQLRVQATDKSKNESGAVDYKIQFEIINKQTITEVMNYPNPFSTSTRFVFTLTGSEVPDVFTIQIMTVTGKVVREINKNEFGNIHIGRNITDYAWDGKDDFGDKLANGVYLYRVITRGNGQAIEKRETDADAYFKKGFGKMVIMR